MKDLCKRISHTFWLFLGLFALLGGYFIYVAAFEAEAFIANPFNARVRVEDPTVRRGNIYDAYGRVIAKSVLTDDGYIRQYPFGAAFAHTIGYSGMGRAGLELSRNFTLSRTNWELFQRARHAIFGDEIAANSITTTFDADLQQMIFEALGNSRGAVVVLNPATGAVLSMVSTPSFNPESIEQNWVTLRADTAASPLLNRAAQGLYPPGSTFKVITAAAAMEFDPYLANFTFECQGQVIIGDNILRCFGGTAHGIVDMERAMAVSCNGYFAVLAEKIGAGALINAAELALFNTPFDFELPAATPQFPMTASAGLSELIETAIGQGRISATPLNMAILAGAIANGGTAMSPHLIYGTNPRRIGQIFEAEIAEKLAEMLVGAVAQGTGAPAAVAGITVAGKTGTAQNETGIDHSWFIGHAPAENPRVALAIIIENTGGGQRASRLAGQIFSHAAR